MGSSYFGDLNLGNGRSGSSSMKGKKSNSDKPKQPQRGLGVAQLERIRLRNQVGFCHLPSLHTPSHAHLNQMGYGERETADGDSQSSVEGRWNYNNGILQPQQAVQASVTRQFLRLPTEDSSKKKRQGQCDTMGSSSQISDSNDIQELDLDLKL